MNNEIFDVEWGKITIKWDIIKGKVYIETQKFNSKDKAYQVYAFNNKYTISAVDHEYFIMPSSAQTYLAIIEIVNVQKKLVE